MERAFLMLTAPLAGETVPAYASRNFGDLTLSPLQLNLVYAFAAVREISQGLQIAVENRGSDTQLRTLFNMDTIAPARADFQRFPQTKREFQALPEAQQRALDEERDTTIHGIRLQPDARRRIGIVLRDAQRELHETIEAEKAALEPEIKAIAQSSFVYKFLRFFNYQRAEGALQRTAARIAETNPAITARRQIDRNMETYNSMLESAEHLAIWKARDMSRVLLAALELYNIRPDLMLQAIDVAIHNYYSLPPIDTAEA